jgi:hypothetical protein
MHCWSVGKGYIQDVKVQTIALLYLCRKTVLFFLISCNDMTIKLTKAATKAKIAEKLRQLQQPKGLDVLKYAGKLKWGKDDLAYQRDYCS